MTPGMPPSSASFPGSPGEGPGTSAPERHLLLRSLLVQGAWNPRDLQWTGVAWILEERPRPGTGPEPFNAHPYLAGVALGALAREAREGTLPPESRSRLRSALRGPLGALGDGLVWAGWLPSLLLLALLALLFLLPGAVPEGGGGRGPALVPAAVVLLFLLAHNLLHLGLRQWAVAFGYRHGAGVGSALGRTHLRALGERARQATVILAGVVGGGAATTAALRLGEGPGGALAVGSGALVLLLAGLLLSGRLPVTTPTRVAALLLLVGWAVSLA